MTEKKVRFSKVDHEDIHPLSEDIQSNSSKDDSSDLSESFSNIILEKHSSTNNNKNPNKRNFFESFCYRLKAAVNGWNNPNKIEELNFYIHELQTQNINLSIYIKKNDKEFKKNKDILIEKTLELEKIYLELIKINEENLLLKENFKKANKKFIYAKKTFQRK